MSNHRRQMVEKFQVVLAAVLALAATYYLVWPLVAPRDTEGAVVFVPVGHVGQLAIFGAIVCGLAAACAILTISSRPESALLATLIGVAGLSLRTGRMRVLLWDEATSPVRLFRLLSVEMLSLGLVLLAAALTVAVMRALSRWLLPRWTWKEIDLDTEPRPSEQQHVARQRIPKGAFGPDWRAVWRTLQGIGERIGSGPGWMWIPGVVMELAVGIVLLVVTFRSTDRGQILFSLSASYLLAALAAHQVFPSRYSLPFYLAPLLMATIVLAVGPVQIIPGTGPAWHEALEVGSGLPLRAALPIDWLAFGCGGAVAGVWFSRRIREARHLEAQAEGQVAPAVKEA